MTANIGETERFVQHMVRQIVSGDLRSGSRLPTESALAGEHGITKTNVHLGVKELERLGFVRIVPRHAVYVADLHESMTLETVDAIFRYVEALPGKEIVEALLEMREMMACGMIFWMTRRPNRAYTDRVGGHIASLEQAAETGDEGTVLTALRELLECVYLEGSNQMFPLLARTLAHSIQQSTVRMAEYLDPKEMAAVYRAVHRHIVAGDRGAAMEVFLTWNDRMTAEFLTAAFPED